MRSSHRGLVIKVDSLFLRLVHYCQ